MSRPVYTVLYSLLIISLFFGTAAIYQSCGKSKKEALPAEDLAEKVEDVANTYTDEAFFEEDEEGATTSMEEESQSNTTKPISPSIKSESRSASAISVSGQYMVIAGNYLLENNADIMVRQLRSNGYNQSEKVVFDLSQYYTVVAGSYESRSVANSISSELTGKGIDNYVLRRK